MKALVLAAGYATRLRPLTDETAKPLLELAGRPMIDFVCDRIDEVAEVEEIHVVSNSRFAADFERWAGSRRGRLRPIVHDDGTRSNDDRLGAVGDLRFVLERLGGAARGGAASGGTAPGGAGAEDMLVVAGDNLFEFSLQAQVDFQRERAHQSAALREGAGASCVAVHRLRDRDRLSLYGIVVLGEDGRVLEFVEKPSSPPSDLVATASYVLAAAHLELIEIYLSEGNSPDQPGRFLAWLHTREPVFGFVFDELWLDIGDHRQYVEAETIMSARAAGGRAGESAGRRDV